MKGLKTTEREFDRRKRIVEMIRRGLSDTGMSQTDVADELCISQPAISSWLSGRMPPNNYHLYLLTKLFNYDFEEYVK